MSTALCKRYTGLLNAQGSDSRTAITRRILSLKREGETDSKFATRIGMTPATISNYRKGQNTAGLTAVVKVLRHLPGVDARWLVSGTEPGRPTLKEQRYGLMERLLAGELDHLAEVTPDGDVELGEDVTADDVDEDAEAPTPVDGGEDLPGSGGE
ncbi:MAG TPA: helix-turn-helix domain-containing protein [Longimicrobiales bacterium]|nr:helix-turn-helix domain-containing protein [Longimicrobiales bacterium]